MDSVRQSALLWWTPEKVPKSRELSNAATWNWIELSHLLSLPFFVDVIASYATLQSEQLSRNIWKRRKLIVQCNRLSLRSAAFKHFRKCLKALLRRPVTLRLNPCRTWIPLCSSLPNSPDWKASDSEEAAIYTDKPLGRRAVLSTPRSSQASKQHG